jgi:hypothetical protein
LVKNGNSGNDLDATVMAEKANAKYGEAKQGFKNPKEVKMKRSRVYPFAVSILLVVLVVSACAAPKTAPVPTTAAQSCPTAAPQSCPTAVAQAMPKMTAFNWTIRSLTNVLITFDKGDKCSMKVINPLTGPDMNLEIEVNDTTYENYMVIYETLALGKTLADLQAWKVADSPPFVTALGLDFVGPLSRTGHVIGALPVGQLYFSCLVQGPDAQKLIGSVGPVEVPAEAP